MATAIGRWADGLAPAARDQLSTYDIRALYDRLTRTGADDGGPGAYDGWVEELGPATRAALSRYDREALIAALASRWPRTNRLPLVSRPQRCATCGGTNLVRAGACITCQDCGTTTGCG
ncbi:MAG: hypothetical protein AAF211_25885 [Myxococcota bacterium]